MSEHVFLLWHTHEPNEEENAKLLGVYSTRAKARGRIIRAKKLPGFEEWPDGFIVDDYEVDKDEWCEGFVTVYS